MLFVFVHPGNACSHITNNNNSWLALYRHVDVLDKKSKSEIKGSPSHGRARSPSRSRYIDLWGSGGLCAIIAETMSYVVDPCPQDIDVLFEWPWTETSGRARLCRIRTKKCSKKHDVVTRLLTVLHVCVHSSLLQRRATSFAC